INWEDVFSDLNSLSVGYLQKIKERLSAALSEKDITAENAKVLAEKIREIENAIGEKRDFMSAILPGLRERKRLTEEAASAESLYQNALMQEVDAINKVMATKTAIKAELDKLDIRDALGQKIEIDLAAISEENKETLLASLEKGSDLYNSLLRLFENLAADQSNLKAKQQDKTNAKTNLDRQWDKLKGMNSVTDIFSWAAGGNPLAIMQGVAQNAQSMSEFVDKIGVGSTDFGEAVHGFADGVGGFNNAVQSLMSGDIFGAVNGILDGVAGFGRMGINALIGAGNEEEMEKEIEELSKSNDNLAKAIESLAERISDTSSTNQESLDAYRDALRAEKEWEENQRKAIDARASEYANSGYGFLGLGGKHSFNANMAGNGWDGWKTFSDILKKHLGENGIEHNSVNRNTIWSLTPEEMKLLQQFAPKEWASLFSTDGHRNPQDLVNEYIDRAGMIDSLTSALNEKLTGYSWEGFLDSYKSLLKDLDSTTEDFAEHINELISNALIESFVNDVLKKDIQDLYNYIADHAADGIDEAEQRQIDAMNKAIADKGLAWRQSMEDAGLIRNNSDNGYEQQASSKGFAAMSQDTADELNGRFTALQIVGERINQNVASILASVLTMSSDNAQANQCVTEIRNLLLYSNSCLEDLKTNSDYMRKNLYTILQNIESRLKNL
ncbi:MAG: hypothetical protein IJS97_00465, partial [Prevotella sp.]|nr:hypothetical protein [Prevotella sp.]